MGKQYIGRKEFKSLLHSTEESRFDLAIMMTLPVVSVAFLWLFTTFVYGLLFIAVLAGSVWLAVQLVRAHLTANAVKVSEQNFPEIYAVLTDVCETLKYDKPVDVYIVEEGTVNAFLTRFLRTKFIILNSELAEDMIEESSRLQLKWVIARFVGALKAKHDKLVFLQIIVESLEKLQIFNLFLLPYERAVQYSGDQIGLAVCGDVNQALIALQKLMVGNKLAKRVNASGVLAQKKDMGVLVLAARLFSTHPHVIDRYANLLEFARQRYPEQYKKLMH